MKRKKKKIRLIKMHPITSIIILTFLVMIVSSILSFFEVQSTYSIINSSGNLETEIVAVEGLFNFNGFKYLISNASVNFASFTPLSTLLLGLIGLSVCHASGFIDAFIKRKTLSIDNKKITFIIIFLATISSIVNEVGYVILIPVLLNLE